MKFLANKRFNIIDVLGIGMAVDFAKQGFYWTGFAVLLTGVVLSAAAELWLEHKSQDKA